MHIILKLSAAYRNCVGVVHEPADEWLCEDCRPHKIFGTTDDDMSVALVDESGQ